MQICSEKSLLNFVEHLVMFLLKQLYQFVNFNEHITATHIADTWQVASIFGRTARH
jgi:hypothetical protein